MNSHSKQQVAKWFRSIKSATSLLLPGDYNNRPESIGS